MSETPNDLSPEAIERHIAQNPQLLGSTIKLLRTLARNEVWQPVKSAPKDGTPILAFWLPWDGLPVNGISYHVVEFTRGEWRCSDTGEEFAEPDFWSSLRAPQAAAPKPEGC